MTQQVKVALDLQQRVLDANLKLYRLGLAPLTWGNVSEVDRTQGIVAIKPSGVAYEELCAEDIVLLNLDGDLVQGNLKPSVDAPTHLALYRAFPEIGGIAHCHSTYAVAWAQAELEIPCFGTTHADYWPGPVPLTRELKPEELESDYEAATAAVIVEALAGRDPLEWPGCLVRPHGPFTWGKDAEDAVQKAIALEKIAEMAALTLRLNPEAAAISEHLLAKHNSRRRGPGAYYGQPGKP